MCLILVSRSARPKEEYIRNAFANHPDGFGVAWRENKELHYKKDLSVDEAIKATKELPIGFVMHARFASVGGKDKSLIHPFPISKDVPLNQEGVAKSLLFHNGHWNDWNSVLLNHLSNRLVLPKGRWSDSRAIAFLVSIHGKDILDLLTKAGKYIVMTEKQTYAFGDFEEHEGVSYSNSTFKTGVYRQAGTTGVSCYTGNGTCQTHTKPYRPRIPYSAPSQPLLTDRTTHEEREELTDEEYKELKSFFELELDTK